MLLIVISTRKHVGKQDKKNKLENMLFSSKLHIRYTHFNQTEFVFSFEYFSESCCNYCINKYSIYCALMRVLHSIISLMIIG